MALLLIVGFYGLAVAAAVGLGYAGIELFRAIGVGSVRGSLLIGIIAVSCLAAAAVIVWSVLPRVDSFEPPGPEIDRDLAPGLFAEIGRLAEAAGQRPPRHVYLVADVNAFVTERGGVMGIGSRRVMGIGLPLFGMLTVSELRAVIAHELGHFYGGDTKIGPWIYKTRGAVGRTVVNLERASDSAKSDDGYVALIQLIFILVQRPFYMFGAWFMHITQAISRAQELAADELSARLAGPEALIGGLKRVHGGAAIFASYFSTEVAPLVESGYRPPIVSGLVESLAGETLARALDEYVADELESPSSDPYDSHPPLRDRVTALEALETGAVELDDRPASVLGDVDRLERTLLAFLTEGAELEDLSWDEAVDRVYIPAWRAGVAEGRAFADVTFADVPEHRERFGAQLVIEIGEDVHDLPDTLIDSWAVSQLAQALAVRLLDRGFVATAHPGAPIVLTGGGLEVRPWLEIGALVRGETDADRWRARCAELEIGQAPIRTTDEARGDAEPEGAR